MHSKLLSVSRVSSWNRRGNNHPGWKRHSSIPSPFYQDQNIDDNDDDDNHSANNRLVRPISQRHWRLSPPQRFVDWRSHRSDVRWWSRRHRRRPFSYLHFKVGIDIFFYLLPISFDTIGMGGITVLVLKRRHCRRWWPKEETGISCRIRLSDRLRSWKTNRINDSALT